MTLTLAVVEEGIIKYQMSIEKGFLNANIHTHKKTINIGIYEELVI